MGAIVMNFFCIMGRVGKMQTAFVSQAGLGERTNRGRGPAVPALQKVVEKADAAKSELEAAKQVLTLQEERLNAREALKAALEVKVSTNPAETRACYPERSRNGDCTAPCGCSFEQ